MNVAAAAAGVLTCSILLCIGSAVLKTLQYIQHCSLITIIKMICDEASISTLLEIISRQGMEEKMLRLTIRINKIEDF
ncbi:CLUMA_CG006803, isoform A [Clunio marinus]|uniref:CLUMA_CG006803, isoform A n=1 Tax=Clunio marinus TaxID=568069 RepID=A0A1J1I0Z8_9DIPT|nr:CLUMA_CG006803, isoform A [Clunio marinus]